MRKQRYGHNNSATNNGGGGRPKPFGILGVLREMNETGSFSRVGSNSMIQMEELPSNQSPNNQHDNMPIVSQGNRIVRSSSESQSLSHQYTIPSPSLSNTKPNVFTTPISSNVPLTTSSDTLTSSSSGTTSGTSSTDSTQIISSSYENHSPSLSSSTTSNTALIFNNSTTPSKQPITDSPSKGQEEETHRPLLSVHEERDSLPSTNSFNSTRGNNDSGSGQKLLSTK